ncbi:DNA methyltransferase [Embleya sp. NBC_00896]|uniref:DNA methyltransferase n=1 Tax=Embleya sp. NBC_00896 TaxID=2975961 RepID=UPI00387057CD|nr:hypothetical protein OG928_15690 [Embleya sp. NBC_00896]
MTYDSLVNHGDYLSAHYLAEVLPKDLKAKDGLLARWAAAEDDARREHAAAIAEAERTGAEPGAVPPRARTPRESLRALNGPYFASRADFERDAAALAEPDAPVPADWGKRLTELHLATLSALGYADAHEQTVTVHRAGHEYSVEAVHAEPGLIAISCGWTARPDAALDPDGAGRLRHPVALEASGRIADAKALTDFLFACDEPPRYVLLVAGGVIVLADRLAWHEGRYLAADLDAALNRRDDRNGGELDTIAALFGVDSLRTPEEGGTAPLAGFVEKSGKHAVGVSTELREGLRLSVEWIANEVLTRLREDHGITPEQIDDPARLAKQLSRESLRYLYRILFLLYAEAQPALGILPSDYPEYARGYGLQRLGDLVVRDLVGEKSRTGFHLYESLDLLFRKVEEGHREYGSEPEDVAADAADRAAAAAEHEAAALLAAGTISQDEYTARVREADRTRRAARSADVGLRFEPLRSDLFKKDAVRLISTDQVENPRFEEGGDEPEFLDTRLRNETLHKVLRRLMLTKGKGRERGGFISYAQLGINQLGAVYEGLMSYSGFIAEEDLYEVAKGGDASGGSWMIPASRVQDYPEEVFVERPHHETGLPVREVHRKGSFVYRLAGRDRQTSASYYTPKSLTEVTVELALKHRLDQDGTVTAARELLEWKICEPALGSGAFLNEAIDQVAAEYLRRREQELGRRVDTEQRQIELQKVKAYVALHNAYGVDLNATAVELAEVSLWLNSMHPGMRAPWFGLHLRRGNSLIGAGRKIYPASELPHGRWLSRKDALPPTELPFRDGELPEGAVHHFLLPAGGWGAVAGESEAKKLAEEQAKALGKWRKGIQRAPKAPKPFEEKGDEPEAKRQKRYEAWQKRAEKSELWRLQRVARRAEFLWSLVAKRLELSEQKISRRIEVWGADWLQHPDEAVDRKRVLDDLTALGTPYWRLRTVMDAWCALWFWPLDKMADLQGETNAYQIDSRPVTAADLPALLSTSVSESGPMAGPEPSAVPTAGDVLWEAASLFDVLAGEQKQLDSTRGLKTAGRNVSGGRKAQITTKWRPTIPLLDFVDWLDFLEATLGTEDASAGTFLAGLDELRVDEALPLLEAFEQSLEGTLGMDEARNLPRRFPWLDLVEDIAGSTERDINAEDGHGFFHWELHFAHVFRSASGGFDLQVGNPPWVRPRWEENALLAEYEPWFMLTEKPTYAERSQRLAALTKKSPVRRYLLRELAVHSGIVAMLGSAQMYPLLNGTHTDLYRAFMCRTWEHMSFDGTVGLIHPDTHFSGDKEARLREAAYTRLRIHGDFVNAGNRFFPRPVGRSSHFGVHIYGRAGDIRFDHLSWLFSVDALRLSEHDDGSGPDPGVRYGSSWDERPHRKRIVRVDEGTLAQWQRLTGDEDQPVRQARLLSPVSTAEAQGIEALVDYPLRLAAHHPQIGGGYAETISKAAGLIDHNVPGEDGSVFEPNGWIDVILKGPQIGLANPFFKQPSQGGGEVLGLNPVRLHADAVPETAYVRVTDREAFESAQPRWVDHRILAQLRQSESETNLARAAISRLRDVALEDVTDLEVIDYLTARSRRKYSDFYRMVWREMIAPDTERSLYVALIPPKATHIDLLHSAALSDVRLTALVAGFWAGLPVDYLLRTRGVGHLKKAQASRMPAPALGHPLESALLLRTLRLNCLTRSYANLWEELYDDAWAACEPWSSAWPDIAPLNQVTHEWRFDVPLRSERARRLALVEIDALVAVWLGVSADALVAMYKARFPIMQDFDAVMWFDAQGRKIAGDRYTFGFEQTKEDYEAFVAYRQGERAEPPRGYTAPFYKANREQEMRSAHAYFEARLQKAIDEGEWTPDV